MDDTSQTVSLEQWPLNPECYVPPGQDPANCHRILAEISPDLFQITGGGVRMYRDCSPQNSDSMPEGIEFHFVSSEMLESTTWDNSTDNIPEGQGMVFWIQPHFSWGQLGITENAFRRLLADHRVFTPLLDIVYGFGAKTNDHQRFRDFVHLHHHTIQDFGQYFQEELPAHLS
ncbi:hypothetical protein FIE12Z_7961 [Fusarium flagelliforme]|uniref:Uncharacterized protein n=1 Tax=Fusarium flagelliforme TaxID=2675880 RepID=A0A395MJB9_9HYPO|nr:hypothetical protein FIE12Z_7961 [Fusarium flagelliforme]